MSTPPRPPSPSVAEANAPVTLDRDDLAAMPESFREAFSLWLQQRRALQAGASFQDAQAVPSVVTIDQLVRVTLQAVHGTMDIVRWQPWLDRFQDAGRPGSSQHRTQLLALVVEARREDLLEAMLAHPQLLPVVPPTPDGATTRSRASSRFDALFNGQMHSGERRATNANGPGVLFLNRFEEQRDALVADGSPLVQALPSMEVARDRQRANLEVEQAKRTRVSEPGGGHQGAMRVTRTAPRSMQPWLQQAVGARFVHHLNLVGLAVLHSWPAGVRRLLNAGVDPYAVGSPKVVFHSALMLAAVLNEPACAQVLIEHPSFSASARYGSTAAEVARLSYDPSASSDGSIDLLWRRVIPDAHGGLDWNLVCRSPVVEAPEVREALWARWQGLKPAARQRLLNADPAAARRWEGLLLRATIDADQPADTLRARPRPRF